MQVGKQEKGSSNYFTKRMALDAIKATGVNASSIVAADIGSGEGQLSKILSSYFKEVFAVDAYQTPHIATNVKTIQSDLNLKWGLPNESIDFAFSLEVLEHLENPRHFFRELNRIIKPGGYAFITTPNNHSVYSKLTFLLKGEHRYFQDPSYPAHITALVIKDFERISGENNLKILKYSYANEDALPLVHYRLKLPGKLFSQSIGLLIQKS
ncbi:MAG: class I SAM-dependent methyltransferase [Agriterribacter sp.]